MARTLHGFYNPGKDQHLRFPDKFGWYHLSNLWATATASEIPHIVMLTGEPIVYQMFWYLVLSKNVVHTWTYPRFFLPFQTGKPDRVKDENLGYTYNIYIYTMFRQTHLVACLFMLYVQLTPHLLDSYCQWIGWRASRNRKPLFSRSKIGLFCKCTLKRTQWYQTKVLP